MLYPNKKLPAFIDKNNIPVDLINKSKLLQSLLSAGNKEIIYKDEKGRIHFQSNIINSDELKKKLESLKDARYKEY